MFSKFINLRLNTKKLLLCIPYSALASVSVYLVQTYAAFLNLTVLFLLLFLFALIAYKNSIRTNVVITTLSLGFSFFLYVISLAVCVPVCYVIYKYMGTTDLSYSLAFLSVGAVQTVLSCLVFRIKRFKKGLTVLEKVSNNDVGMVISIFLLFAASLFYSSNINSFITLCLVFLIIFCGVVFVIWWKRHLERGYHAKIYQRNIAALESKIDEQTQEIDNLKQ
ncbi:MAG: hypothetical protein LUF33_03095, partial [Clostridiales bacterium]|nr:hypothetical protein [Clostridiales bacterium]